MSLSFIFYLFSLIFIVFYFIILYFLINNLYIFWIFICWCSQYVQSFFTLHSYYTSKNLVFIVVVRSVVLAALYAEV